MPAPDDRYRSSAAKAEMLETVEEYGRTYTTTTNYLLPNDVQEHDRLEIQHSIYFELLGNRLYLAPIEDRLVRNVMDLATGNGNWAVAFAKQFTSANVVGTDLSPVFEEDKPRNCHFVVEDAEDEWSHGVEWDYIHGRALVACFSDKKSVFRKAFSALTPGGYLELQDAILPWQYATPPPKDSAFLRWNIASQEASLENRCPWNQVIDYPDWLREIGFKDVEVYRFFLPTGTWTNDPHIDHLGAWQMLNTNLGMEGWTLRNLESAGWTSEQIQKLMAEAKEELSSGTLQSFTEIQVVYGRKPI